MTGTRNRMIRSLCITGVAAWLGVWAPQTAAAADSTPYFTDATKDSGLDYRNVCGASPGSKGWLTEAMGSGAAFLDYDGDGNLDLYVVNGSAHDRPAGGGEPNRLFRGDGAGRFTDVTRRAGVGHRGWGQGVTVGDVDNDGDPDLFVTNIGPNVLYRNNGDGTFEDVTGKAGVGHAAWSTSAAFFDYDGDGYLDLYVANYMESDPAKLPRRGSEEAVSVYCTYKGIPVFCGPLGQRPEQDVLYRNNGDGTFTDASRSAGVHLDLPRYALGVVSGDFDNDGDADLYVANDSVTNTLWQNRGDGTFVDVGVGSLSGLNADGRAQAGMGTDFADFNGDGWLDIVVTNFAHDTNTLYQNVQGRYFIDNSALAGMGTSQLALSWGTGFWDFDNDGDLDLFVANGHIYPQVDDYDLGTSFRQTNHLFVNEEGRFRDASAEAGPGLAIRRSFRGAAFGDYDNDGDVDVFLTALDDAGLLLRNDARKPGHFLQVRLIGARSNRDGVGARVVVVADKLGRMRERKGGGSFLSASDPRLHFGLGAQSQVQLVDVRWPSGLKTSLRDLAADRLVTIEEQPKN